jgi:hypothetical protein
MIIVPHHNAKQGMCIFNKEDVILVQKEVEYIGGNEYAKTTKIELAKAGVSTSILTSLSVEEVYVLLTKE